MPGSDKDNATWQNIAIAVNGLNQTLAQVFPGMTAVSTTAPSSVGALTFSSSQPKGFITVISSSGVSYQIPVY